jgi:phospholipid transport system transporter-binding protein
MTSNLPAIALPAQVLQAQAQSVADGLTLQLLSRVAQGHTAELDASALSHFDSSALAVVLACRRAVLAKGAHLHLHGLPARASARACVRRV